MIEEQTLQTANANSNLALLDRAGVSSYFPFLLVAVLNLMFMVWAGITLWSVPYVGLTIDAERPVIRSVDRSGPAAHANVRRGDRIVSVDGEPLTSETTLHTGKAAGDRVKLTLLRNDRYFSTDVVLSSLPWEEHLLRLEPLLVGFVFWIVASIIWALHPFSSITRLFFIMSQLAAGTLVAGDLTAGQFYVEWTVTLFRVLLIFLSASVLHFYARFPYPLPARLRYVLLRVVYCSAIVLSFITVAAVDRVGPLSSSVVRNVFIALTLIGAVVLLFRRQPSAPLRVRQRRRLLVAGMVVSLSPSLFLSFLPLLLWGEPAVAYVWTFPFLMLLPLSYAYAVRCGELGRIDLFLNRSIVYALVTFMFLSLCATCLLVLEWMMPSAILSRPVIGAGVAVVVAAFFHPVRVRVQQWVDNWFYGGWYDYRSVIREMSAEFSRALELEHVVEQILAVARTMRFQAAVLLRPDGARLTAHASFGYDDTTLRCFTLTRQGVFVRRLRAEGRPLLQEQLRALPATTHELTPQERHLQKMSNVHLWLPLISRGELQAVLVMGNRQSEVLLGAEDLDILNTIAEQAAVALENANLVDALQRRVRDLSHLTDASIALRGTEALQDIGPVLATQAARLVGCDVAIVGLIDQDQDETTICGAVGISSRMIGRALDDHRGIVTMVAQTGRPYRSECLDEDALVTNRTLFSHMGPGLCLPLKTTGGDVVGTLLVAQYRHTADVPRQFTASDEQLLTTLAEIAANVLDRAQAHAELEEAYLQTILALARTVNARDAYTGDHSRELVTLARATSKQLGLCSTEIEIIRWGALLHDIGKIGVPDEILLKPGPLTDEEWAIMQQHPVLGAEIVSPIDRLASVAPIIRAHHERYDGSGYPDGLRGKDIPIGARILTVVDAYSAMTDDRVYRSARTHESALQEIKHGAGNHFDPKVVDAFLRVFNQETDKRVDK